jgi:hypothetical protein
LGDTIGALAVETMTEPEKFSTDELFASSRIRSPELLRLYRPETAQHCVQFYEDESLVIKNVAYLAGKALETGGATVLIATPAHLQAIEERLTTSASELKHAREAGRYLALNAAETLEKLLTDGEPDKAKFDRLVGQIVRGAGESCASGFVFAFGEMVALLCAAQKPDAALRLEQLWNELAKAYRFSLYCAYPLDAFADESDLNAFFEICSEHALTIPAETPL